MPLINKIKENTFMHSAYKELYDPSTKVTPLINKNHESIPSLIQNWPYKTSSWPIIIKKELTNQFEIISQRISNLLNQIPSLYFKNDINEIADYYFDSDYQKAEQAMEFISKDISNCQRLDLCLTKSGFKILEVNLGASLGGSEVQYFDPIMQINHLEFFQEKTFKLNQIQDNFVQYLINETKKLKPSTDTLNIFLSCEWEGDDLNKNLIIDFLKSVIRKKITNNKFNVFLDTPSLLQFEKELKYKGHRIDAVMLLYVGETLTPNIINAHKKNKIFSTDHLGLEILSNKKNLALLYRMAQKKTFRESDNKLILNCIPWTSELIDQKVTYQCSEINLIELMTLNKDNFVIKPGSGFSGNNITVGKFNSNEKWNLALRKAEKEGDYIVQEFCDSLDYYTFNEDNLISKFKIIWGAFAFGNTYGGVMVRMSEMKQDKGVVNGATGALASLVYEEV